MNVLIIGADGYIGWPLAMALSARGHHVTGIDNFARRKWVKSAGGDSAIPVPKFTRRAELWAGGPPIDARRLDCQNYQNLSIVLEQTAPAVIVHLGEMPSAPYSMGSHTQAAETISNNVLGTNSLLWAMQAAAPTAHLVKLGTMGEYGTPPIPIAEGFFPVEYKGHQARVMFPRQPGSLYHVTKVQDSALAEFASRAWELDVTDIMQGVVYGTRTPEITTAGAGELATRFDFDSQFGTVINRFCTQAIIGVPLTVYGTGGQTRGFLPLADSIQCLTRIVEAEQPEGYRVINQLDHIHSILELAIKVKNVAGGLGMNVEIDQIHNPRVEAEDHFYKVEAAALAELGYQPTADPYQVIEEILTDLAGHKDRLEAHRAAIMPRIKWRGGTAQLHQWRQTA